MRFRVHHTRRRRVGVFLLFHTRQQKAQIAGEHEKALGLLQLAACSIGAELIEGVEGLKLDARVRKKRGEGHGLMKGFDAAEDFKLPVITVEGEDGTPVEETVSTGKLKFELYIKAGKSAIYDVYEQTEFDAEQGYSKKKNSYFPGHIIIRHN